MRKYLKFAVLCLLAAAILVWFGRNLNWEEVSTAISRADKGLIAAALGCVCLTYFLRALRWRALLGPLAPGASLRELFAATTVGFGAVFLVGRAGEVVRPAFLPLRERRVRPGASFVTIAVERVYDMAAMVVMFAANLLFFHPPGADAAAYARVRWAGFVMLLGAAVGIAALVWFRRNAEWVVSRLEGWFDRAPQFVSRFGRIATGLLAQLAHSLGVLVDARELVLTAGLTALLWFSIALADLFVMRAFGLDFGLTTAIFVLGWSLVGSLVPTPGGAAGTFHAATAAGLIFLGVARAEAAAISIVLHLVMFGTALPFGLYYFLRSDVSLARLRGLAAAEEGAGQNEHELKDETRAAPSVEERRTGGDAPRQRVKSARSPETSFIKNK